MSIPRAAVLLGVVCVAGACGPRSFVAEFPAFADSFGQVLPMPVAFTDHTGLVLAIAAGAPAKGRDSGASPVNDDPLALELAWVGGACASRATMSMQQVQGRYVVAIREENPGACRVAGSPGVQRVLLVKLSRQVSPHDFDVNVE